MKRILSLFLFFGLVGIVHSFQKTYVTEAENGRNYKLTVGSTTPTDLYGTSYVYNNSTPPGFHSYTQIFPTTFTVIVTTFATQSFDDPYQIYCSSNSYKIFEHSPMFLRTLKGQTSNQLNIHIGESQ